MHKTPCHPHPSSAAALRVLQGDSDAGVARSIKAYFPQQILHHPVQAVAIPAAQNGMATCAAARMKDAPNAPAARNFLAFMQAPAAPAIYRKYDFLPPH